jgi:hypothetical protein
MKVSCQEDALALVKDFKKVQTGGYILSDVDLANMSTMTTFKALKNSRKFKVENNKLVPETDPNSLTSQYIVDLASESVFWFIKPILRWQTSTRAIPELRKKHY